MMTDDHRFHQEQDNTAVWTFLAIVALAIVSYAAYSYYETDYQHYQAGIQSRASSTRY